MNTKKWFLLKQELNDFLEPCRLMENKKAAVLGYSFKDSSLFELAITHRSVSSLNNERLEFLGDSLLGFIISAEITEKFPQASEGDLTRIRASLVNRESLSEIASQHEIGKIILLGEGEKKSGGHRRPSILADVLESLLGAVYQDSDFETVKRIILDIFQSKIDSIESTTAPKDSKTELQEHLQSLGLALPEYRILKETGPDHKKHFNVECITELSLDNQKASGASKRKAEQAAAAITLDKIRLS